MEGFQHGEVEARVWDCEPRAEVPLIVPSPNELGHEGNVHDNVGQGRNSVHLDFVEVVDNFPIELIVPTMEHNAAKEGTVTSLASLCQISFLVRHTMSSYNFYVFISQLGLFYRCMISKDVRLSGHQHRTQTLFRDTAACIIRICST